MPARGILYNIQRMSVHDGPGLRTTVFFKGCPLSCCWCSNPESQHPRPQLMFFSDLCVGCGICMSACTHGAISWNKGKAARDFSRCVACGACTLPCPSGAASMSGREYEVDDVMEIVRKDAAFYNNSGGGVTFSGGECTMQAEFLYALMDACQSEGFHTCVDTCGQCAPHIFSRILSKADLFLFDVKHMDSTEHRRLVGVGNETIQRNLKTALDIYPEKIRIRIPLMPGLNDSEENIAALAALLAPYGVKRVDVLPCHSFGSSKYDALGLPQPGVPEYSPEGLRVALDRFATHGLETEIV